MVGLLTLCLNGGIFQPPHLSFHLPLFQTYPKIN